MDPRHQLHDRVVPARRFQQTPLVLRPRQHHGHELAGDHQSIFGRASRRLDRHVPCARIHLLLTGPGEGPQQALQEDQLLGGGTLVASAGTVVVRQRVGVGVSLGKAAFLPKVNILERQVRNGVEGHRPGPVRLKVVDAALHHRVELLFGREETQPVGPPGLAHDHDEGKALGRLRQGDLDQIAVVEFQPRTRAVELGRRLRVGPHRLDGDALARQGPRGRRVPLQGGHPGKRRLQNAPVFARNEPRCSRRTASPPGAPPGRNRSPPVPPADTPPASAAWPSPAGPPGPGRSSCGPAARAAPCASCRGRC